MEPRDAAICRAEPGFVWLGMLEPSPDELTRVQGIFGLHELAMEDAQNFNLRPKVEQHEGRRLLRGAAHGALRRHARRSSPARSRSSSDPAS
jgi:hypothetical protein